MIAAPAPAPAPEAAAMASPARLRLRAPSRRWRSAAAVAAAAAMALGSCLAFCGTSSSRATLRGSGPAPSAANLRPAAGHAVSTAALGEVGDIAMLLASTDPTPAVVSVAFNIITFLPQNLWLLMVFLPGWSVTRKLMEPLWVVLLFSLVHSFIVFNVASTNPDNMADFTELLKVFDPRINLELLSNFSPQASMMNLMKSPGFVSEEWSHVLAWDLFVGRWIYLDGQRRGIFTSHSVLFCNLIGPPGLLLHAATCLLTGKGLPTEAPLSDEQDRQ